MITPGAARDLTVALWQLRTDAIAANDSNALGEIETGAALAVDAARGTCSCGRTDHFGSPSEVTVEVARNTTFPARFLAGLRTTYNSNPWISLLIISRQSAQQPWRIEFAGGFNPSSPNVTPPFAPTDSQGYIFDPSPQLAKLSEGQPANLADYWQSWKDHGSPASNGSLSWAPGALTDQWGQKMVHAGMQGQINTDNGMIGYYKFEVDPSATPLIIPFGTTSALVCQPILEQLTWAGGTYARGPYQPPNRTNWGSDVRPGVYRAVMSDEIWSPCIQMTQSGPNIENVVAGVEPFIVADVAIPYSIRRPAVG